MADPPAAHSAVLTAPHACARAAHREVIGAALKSLGLGYNATAAEIRRCGLSEENVRSRVQRFVRQVRGQAWASVPRGDSACGRQHVLCVRPLLTCLPSCPAIAAAPRLQVRAFSSRDHVRALSAGEVDVVVGWSGALSGGREAGLALVLMLLP